MTRQAILDRGRDDPAWFVRNALRQDATSYSQAILQSVSRNRHTRVKSAHAISKTFTAALATCWWLPTHSPSQVISTAPTDRQIKDQLWAEVGRIYAGSAVKLSDRPPDTQQWVLGKKWFGTGFTSAPNKPTSFQGYHSPNMLVIVDEACGVSKQIYDEGVSACMTGNARLLSIGNPTDGSSEFAKAFTDPAPGSFTVSAFDTPNFTTFGITIDDIRSGEWVDKIAGRPLPRPYLTTPEWVAERYTRWGEESPLWLGRVMAVFPGSGDGALAELEWLTRAQREFKSGVWPTERTKDHVLGVDVARTGADSTKIYERKGRWCRRLLEVHGADTMVVVGHIIMLQRQTGAARAHIDEIGIGAGVVDRLHEIGHTWAVGVNNGARAQDEERFKNIRAESYWGVRQALERGDLFVLEEEFADEITKIKWRPTSLGKIQIEDKDEVKRRLGRSPDDADAVALTFAKANRIVVV